MTNQNPSEMLRKAWALIDAPEKWTQCAYARNVNGRDVHINSDDAVCFCTYGAVDKTCRHKVEVYSYLIKVMDNISQFNDTHTWEEVKSAWMKAIALAEEDEAKNEQTI